jgi:endonuclease/exonuclease/phosphatase family metal-dependent hydrolase
MEHLAEANGSGCRPRTNADYVAMRAYIDAVDADVIAFQEVETAAAAARVFDPERYQIVIEGRVDAPGGPACNNNQPGQNLNRQATGFAIRRGIAFDRNPDFTALQGGNPNMRSGVDITLRPTNGAPIRLLSVHLKSGCFSGNAPSNEDCPILFRQVPELERWIDARAAAGEGFAVLGDFNRRLAIVGDVVWAEWDDGVPPNAALALAAGDAPPRCDARYSSVDHIVLDRSAAQRAGAFREWTYSGVHLSDHCAISVGLN